MKMKFQLRGVKTNCKNIDHLQNTVLLIFSRILSKTRVNTLGCLLGPLVDILAGCKVEHKVKIRKLI